MNINILNKALQAVEGDRKRDYDHPLWNFLRIALFWNAHLISSGKLKALITPEEVAWLMVGLKQARHMYTPKEDNLIDALGYIVCIEQMNALMRQLGYKEGVHYFEGKSLEIYHTFLETHYEKNSIE